MAVSLEKKQSTEIDWALLRNALIVLCLTVLAVGSWIYWAQDFQKKMIKREKRENANLEKITELFRETDEAARIIQSSYPRYKELRRRGFIHDGPNYDWAAGLASLKKLQLPRLDYDLKGRANNYAPPDITIADDFQVYETKVEFNLGLLHELDLFKFFETLREQDLLGIFSIDACTLDQQSDSLKLPPDKPRLTAECTLLLYNAGAKHKK